MVKRKRTVRAVFTLILVKILPVFLAEYIVKLVKLECSDLVLRNGSIVLQYLVFNRKASCFLSLLPFNLDSFRFVLSLVVNRSALASFRPN